MVLKPRVYRVLVVFHRHHLNVRIKLGEIYLGPIQQGELLRSVTVADRVLRGAERVYGIEILEQGSPLHLEDPAELGTEAAICLFMLDADAAAQKPHTLGAVLPNIHAEFGAFPAGKIQLSRVAGLEAEPDVIDTFIT
ncbi:MAG TPA: hypothetical protein PLN83_01860 [Syntrophorhabdus sp.]|nr:hypothetical protein [Syntrophorhabdus sp.]